MAAPQKKPRIDQDQFTEDGVRLFNPSKEHGVVYSDGFIEARFMQAHEGEEVAYRADGFPVGYTPPEKPAAMNGQPVTRPKLSLPK